MFWLSQLFCQGLNLTHIRWVYVLRFQPVPDRLLGSMFTSSCCASKFYSNHRLLLQVLLEMFPKRTNVPGRIWRNCVYIHMKHIWSAQYSALKGVCLSEALLKNVKTSNVTSKDVIFVGLSSLESMFWILCYFILLLSDIKEGHIVNFPTFISQL